MITIIERINIKYSAHIFLTIENNVNRHNYILIKYIECHSLQVLNVIKH